MQVAFYRGKTRLFNRLVSWFLQGDYSHCELILQHLGGGVYLCASSSFMDGGVRLKPLTLDAKHWDIVTAFADSHKASAWFYDRLGRDYDVRGLLGFVWRRTRDSRSKYFCSEAVASALGFDEAWRYDPCTLHSALTRAARN